MKLFIACLTFGLIADVASTGRSSTETDSSEKTTPTFCVCIDPGHPSEKNDGMTLTNGLREVSVNWEIAQLLKQELENDGTKVVLTKSAEAEFVTNENRAAIANQQHANLFLRLHADAGNSTGFTIYYPHKEGSVRGISGPAQSVIRSSAVAAQLFHRAFAKGLHEKLRDNGVHGDEDTLIGSRQGALTGSIFSKVPTILVEMVFLTNPKDAEWIKQSENQLIMAKALAAGVRAVQTRHVEE